jgi:glycosyltransferase involved in cell wall biosynthesis
MKICLIGPGIMTIPPPGWGAVEILIWEYYEELKMRGHEIDIINIIRDNQYDQSNPSTKYCQNLITTINKKEYDFVHLHYDCLYHILPFIKCKNKGITSHYPYIDQKDKHKSDGYFEIFKEICDNDSHYIFALSKKDYNTFKDDCKDKTRLFLLINGANHKDITVELNGRNKTKSIYIGKVEERKQQFKYCKIPNIDFYGKCDDEKFKNLDCYKGEFEHKKLMDIMKTYGNLILLSKGENGTPLVIKEGLMAGLPIVTNKYSSNDLNINLPYIDIIPDEKLDDLQYIENIIKENLKKQNHKDYIRKYSVDNFSWKVIINSYLKNIDSIL